MPLVNLEWYEVSIAAQVGARRQISSMSRGSVPNFSMKGTGWEEHTRGALGEMAVAKYLDLYWSGSVDTFALADIGREIQVRTTDKDTNRLIVRPVDDNEACFVLARGRNDHYDIVGWVFGLEAKRPELSQAPGGRDSAYFVPDSALRPITELRAGIDSIKREKGN